MVVFGGERGESGESGERGERGDAIRVIGPWTLPILDRMVKYRLEKGRELHGKSNPATGCDTDDLRDPLTPPSPDRHAQ